MANPNNGNAQYDLEKETGVLIVDNCARTTLLNTLFNMSEVQRYSVKISLAVDKGNTWIQDLFHQRRNGAIQKYNNIFLCTGPAARFITLKGAFKCALSSNS